MDEPYGEGLAPVMVCNGSDEIVLDLKRDGLSILLVEQNLTARSASPTGVYVLETGQDRASADAK